MSKDSVSTRSPEVDLITLSLYDKVLVAVTACVIT
jgi:hypothetical protein